MEPTRDRMVGVLMGQLGGEAEEIVMTGVQLIEQGRKEGRAEGEAKGLAGAIIRVLVRRELDVPQDVRTHIEACTDPERLSRWFDLAFTVPSARDVIAD